MFPAAFIISLIILPAAALVVLVWWRFFGEGKYRGISSQAILVKKPFNMVRTFSYDVSEFTKPLPIVRIATWQDLPTTASAEEKNLLEELERSSAGLPESDAGQVKAENRSEDTPGAEEKDKKEPLVANPKVKQNNKPQAHETEDLPAKSLYHNPITAEAPTDIDKSNRFAVSELRKRKRAELKAGTSEAGKALGKIFS